jgi:endoglucanase
MKMWVDNQGAYSMNEIAINWNAPLVFLLAAANGKEQG